MSDLKIHVGEPLEAMGQRFAAVWNRADGGAGAAEHHLSFDSFETLARVLTPKRLELLRRVHAQPCASIAGLARALGRDYKRVHEDVEALTQVGLIARDSARSALTAPYDEIQTTIAM